MSAPLPCSPEHGFRDGYRCGAAGDPPDLVRVRAIYDWRGRLMWARGYTAGHVAQAFGVHLGERA
jgi:hypothetical protein